MADKKFECSTCEDVGRTIRYGDKQKGEPHIVKSFCRCKEGRKQLESIGYSHLNDSPKK